MARTNESAAESVAYRGEVWTDGSGRAVVVLPPEAVALAGPVAYTLEPAEPSISAAVATELEAGRFTIETDEPHVKVAWRIVSPDHSRHEPKHTTPGGKRSEEHTSEL